MDVTQEALFETPAEAHRREWEELTEAWWSGHATPDGRYRCPLCGRIERTRFMFGLNHDLQPGSLFVARGARPGRFCTSRHIGTLRALSALRFGTPDEWREASMNLRKMAAARRGWPW